MAKVMQTYDGPCDQPGCNITRIHRHPVDCPKQPAAGGAMNIQTNLQQLAVIKQALEEQLTRQPTPTPDQIDKYGSDIRKSLVDCITMTQNDPGDRKTLHGFVV